MIALTLFISGVFAAFVASAAAPAAPDGARGKECLRLKREL